MIFTPTRESGLTRLSEFLPDAGRNYARRRNTDRGRGEHDHVSCLSPYIRHRLITEREVTVETLGQHSMAESEKFIQEVFWRTYFKGWLEQRPQVWAHYQNGVAEGRDALGHDAALKARYQRAVTGQTGIECFDYWALELTETGYLHNHARMWFASIWIFTLKLPWELGADLFMQHLFDGDPASNTLSWRWVGGLHTKGKTYLARPDNIERFTNGRFNPQGQLSSAAEPLTEAEDITLEQSLPQQGVMPSAPFIWLIHEEDCDVMSLLPDGNPPAAIIGAVATHMRSPSGVSEAVARFARAAVQNALSRTGGEAEVIEMDWAGSLITACQEHAVSHIVTPYIPVGPCAQALKAALPTLEKNGINVTQIIRSWDSLTWPYANRGFFKVKKKIPKILDALHHHDIQRPLI